MYANLSDEYPFTVLNIPISMEAKNYLDFVNHLLIVVLTNPDRFQQFMNNPIFYAQQAGFGDINPYFLTNDECNRLKMLEVEIRFEGEMDEFWSFVQKKSNQRWTWYAIERTSGCILAWHNGTRQDVDFLILWRLLQSFPIAVYHTDDWGRIRGIFPPECTESGRIIRGKSSVKT